MPKKYRDDGTPTASPNRRNLTDMFVKKTGLRPHAYLVWDTHQHGLALQVRPSGHKAWKCIYSMHGRPRWYHIGDVTAFGLSDARKLASRVMFKVAEGKDP